MSSDRPGMHDTPGNYEHLSLRLGGKQYDLRVVYKEHVKTACLQFLKKSN